MLDWLKRSNNTDTQLLKQNHQLQKLLADSLKDSQKLNQRLTDALDRVVQSRFDPPLKPNPQAQPDNTPFPDVSDVLSIEDDAEFITRMEKAISE